MMMPELKNPGFFNHICFAFILHDFQVAVNSFDFLFSAKSITKNLWYGSTRGFLCFNESLFSHFIA